MGEKIIHNKIKILIHILMVVMLVAVDQLTKKLAAMKLLNTEGVDLIPNILRLQYLENKGAAWGVMQGQTIVFSIITVIIVVIAGYFFLKTPNTKRFTPFRIAITFLIAGAIGNFIDRIIKHFVIDFIYFKAINFPIFNVADIYVTCSATFLLILFLFVYKEEELQWNTTKKE